MKKSTVLFLLGSLASILLSAYIIRLLYVPVNPYSMVSLPVGGEEAGQKAASMVRQLGMTMQIPAAGANLKVRSDLVNTILSREGQLRGTELLRRSTEGCYWEVEWNLSRGMVQAPTDTQSFQVSVGKSEKDSGDIRIRFSPKGSLQYYHWHIPDSLDLPRVTQDWARQHAVALFDRLFPALAGMDSFDINQSILPHRVLTQCNWVSTDTLLHLPVSVKVEYAGDRVQLVEVGYRGLAGGPKTVEAIIQSALVGVLIVALLLISAIVAIRRMRAYELSFALAVKAGVAVGIVTALSVSIQSSPRELWLTLLAALFSGLFIGGMFIVLWGVGESLGRETWKEKFLSVDLLTRGHIFHSLVGRSLVLGSVLGIAAPSLYLLVAFLVLRTVPGVTLSIDGELVKILSARSPIVTAISESITGSVFFVAFGIVALSYLRAWIRNRWILVILGSLLLVMGTYGRIDVHPMVAILLLGLPGFLPLSFALVGVDVLSAFVALFLSIFVGIVALFFSAGVAWGAAALFLTCFACIPLAWGMVALLTADPSVDLEAITPLFARYITERQRLQRELEIARQVQQSFLPKRTPEVKGLDVASRCVPALEVGGDYYDFVMLERGRLGLVIGDVSGKGTEAAFFMTLSKGFLRAITKSVESPQEVMIRLNELFCENVDRGEFITMVYAVLDPSTGRVTLARAGHTPPMLWRSEQGVVEMFQPPGLGLGLEPGQRFADVIREETFVMEEGDYLLFYTDGFTEAMNKAQEEYGENRLRVAVGVSPKSNARDFLESLYADVRKFTGHAAQHDDMTAVVVRRTPADPRPGQS